MDGFKGENHSAEPHETNQEYNKVRKSLQELGTEFNIALSLYRTTHDQADMIKANMTMKRFEEILNTQHLEAEENNRYHEELKKFEARYHSLDERGN